MVTTLSASPRVSRITGRNLGSFEPRLVPAGEYPAGSEILDDIFTRRKILLGNSSRSLPCLKFGSSWGRRKMEGRKEGYNLVFRLKRIIEGIFLRFKYVCTFFLFLVQIQIFYTFNSFLLRKHDSEKSFENILEDILESDAKGARKCIEECFIVLSRERERGGGEDMAKIHCLSISAVYNAIQFNDRDLKAQRKLPSARFVSYCR